MSVSIMIYYKFMLGFVKLLMKHSTRRIIGKHDNNWDNLLQQFRIFVKDNNAPVIPRIIYTDINDCKDGKYVGALLLHPDLACCIPNSSRQIICFDPVSMKYKHWGLLSEGNFKWTGGGKYKNIIYAFPRTSNCVLCIDCERETTEEMPLPVVYEGEHHYGGVITDKGYIYQPPRNADHILKININTWEVSKIYLVPRLFHLKLRYCGSICHPNGFIYFLPEREERVIKFDPDTDQFEYIGRPIKECMVFSAVVMPDGNIYGFSLYKGILKIDVENEDVTMIFYHINFGCYGTKLGINGHAYGIPGSGTEFWEYDAATNDVRSCGTNGDKKKAKCAGGFTDTMGNIHMAPAFGDKIYSLIFNNKKEIPEIIYKMFFTDNY